MQRPPSPIHAVADRHGVVLRRDAVAATIDDNALARLVKQRVIVRMRQGIYCLADVYGGADAAERHLLLAHGVMRLYDDHVALSHGSSCLLQRGPSYGLDLSNVHLTHLHGGGRRQARVVHHVGELLASDLRRQDGMWVTTPGRAVVELTCLAGSEVGLVQANHFLHAGLLLPAELSQVFRRLGLWAGSLSQHAVAMLANPKIESVGESRCQWLFWTEGLPAPDPQFEVRGPNGEVVAKVDFAWPHLGVIVEFDGREKYHRYRRAGETIEQMVWREKKREDLIRRLTGWTVIRLTWADLAFPARTARLVRDSFRRPAEPAV